MHVISCMLFLRVNRYLVSSIEFHGLQANYSIKDKLALCKLDCLCISQRSVSVILSYHFINSFDVKWNKAGCFFFLHTWTELLEWRLGGFMVAEMTITMREPLRGCGFPTSITWGLFSSAKTRMFWILLSWKELVFPSIAIIFPLKFLCNSIDHWINPK